MLFAAEPRRPPAKETFPAGGMVFFIPWRVVAEESGAAHFGLGGAMLLDPLGPMVRPPAAPASRDTVALLGAISAAAPRTALARRARRAARRTYQGCKIAGYCCL